MTAQINGTGWSAQSLVAFASYNVQAQLLVLTGLNTTSYSIAINLADVAAAGTYTLTATFPLRFAVATTNQGGEWGSTYNGGAGTVTISTFTETRVVGTFSFTAPEGPTSSVPGTLTITSGQFDLPVQRLLGP